MPPFVGVAVNVVFVPTQIVVVPAMLTLTGRLVFTVIVKVFDVAGFPVAQAALEVKIQVIASAFANAELEYVLMFVPTFVPFIFHW